MTHLAVFGASGRTGALLVDAALSRGLGVRALLRPTARYDARPGVTVLRGSLDEAYDVEATVAGAAAVCCVFGPRATSDPPFVARATAQIVSAMRSSGIARLVCLTGAMAGELSQNVSLPMRAMAGLYRRVVPRLAVDAAEQERIVMESGLDWTIVKPPRLTDEPPLGRSRAGAALRVGLMSRIARSDLATFLLDEATRARHSGERVYVSR